MVSDPIAAQLRHQRCDDRDDDQGADAERDAGSDPGIDRIATAPERHRLSPAVLGVGNGENFLASDVSAIVAYTRDAVYLNDFDLVAAGPDKFEISSLAGDITEHPVSKVEPSGLTATAFTAAG